MQNKKRVRRRGRTNKKRIEEPEPPVKPPIEQPPITPDPPIPIPPKESEGTNLLPATDGAIDWACNWTEPRTLGPPEDDDITDPKDNRCRLLDVGDPAAFAVIAGGENLLDGGSPRFYINGRYVNVEFETELFVEEHVSQVYLSAKSNHQIREPPGYGGLPLYLDMRGDMFFKKEVSHRDGYSERLNSVDIIFPVKTWVKARVRIKTIDNNKNVQAEAWFKSPAMKEIAYTKLVDSGQILCKNDKTGEHPNTKPYTAAGESCFLRLNGDGEKVRAKCRFRNTMIKTI